MKLWDDDLELEEFQADIARRFSELQAGFSELFAGMTPGETIRVRAAPKDWQPNG